MNREKEVKFNEIELEMVKKLVRLEKKGISPLVFWLQGTSSGVRKR